VDGKKVFSRSGNFTVSGGSIRWSAGLYATRGINQTPTGSRTLVLFHDHFRVATTYEEADPASWDDGGAPPAADAGPPATDAGPAAAPDAGPAVRDAAEAPGATIAPDAAPSTAGGAGGMAGAPGTGGASTGGRPGTGGQMPADPDPTPSSDGASGCT
jgi:hypothetical protein